MAGMIVGQFVHADLDLSGAVAFLGLHTAAGREYAAHRFKHPVDTEAGLRTLQDPVIAIRRRFRLDEALEHSVCAVLAEIGGAEVAANEIIQYDTIDKRIAETVEQVYWKTGTLGSFMNTWGRVIEFILFYKTLFLPGFAVLVPFLVVIIPYFLLRHMFGMPITVTDYCRVLQRLLLTNAPRLPMGDAESPVAQAAKYLYVLMSAGVFVSNIWNQIQAAVHLRSVAHDIRARGQQLLDYVSAARRLAILLGSDEGRANADSVGFTEETNALGAFGIMYNESRGLARLRDWVAEIDLRVATARLKGICFPSAVAGSGFKLQIKGLYHPGVPAGRRVLNDYSSDSHILLTGPNRGGKSTLCKSLGLAVMTAQSWGITWARSMSFVPIVRFETALAPADTLGRLSLFEAEIEFAKHLIGCASKAREDKQEGPLLIIMDEIFHSTNAHDGAEASLIFLKQLYEKGGAAVGSLVSTHYRELPDHLGSLAKTWCMEAHDKGQTGIQYTYRCVPGISTVSSVREILQERGLLVS
uniref:DNA mismatch repair proteins mutS family domain-containing protein n=1 Tax=viral metagenome TaxID=1070528 RepID=A0A6C0DT10_9ZZZZ